MSKGEKERIEKRGKTIGWDRLCDRVTGRIGSDTCKHLHTAIQGHWTVTHISVSGNYKGPSRQTKSSLFLQTPLKSFRYFLCKAAKGIFKYLVRKTLKFLYLSLFKYTTIQQRV